MSDCTYCVSVIMLRYVKAASPVRVAVLAWAATLRWMNSRRTNAMPIQS